MNEIWLVIHVLSIQITFRQLREREILCKLRFRTAAPNQEVVAKLILNICVFFSKALELLLCVFFSSPTKTSRCQKPTPRQPVVHIQIPHGH